MICYNCGKDVYYDVYDAYTSIIYCYNCNSNLSIYLMGGNNDA